MLAAAFVLDLFVDVYFTAGLKIAGGLAALVGMSLLRAAKPPLVKTPAADLGLDVWEMSDDQAPAPIEASPGDADLDQTSPNLEAGVSLLRAVEDEATRDRELLLQSVEALAEGFSLWDEQDQLVICNQFYRDLAARCGFQPEIGASFVETQRSFASRGFFDIDAADLEGWLADRMRRRRDPGDPVKVGLADGGRLLERDQILPDVGVVTITLDVSDQKRAEAALQEREALLASILDNLPVALMIKDHRHFAEQSNRTYKQWYGVAAEELGGQAAHEIVDFQPSDDVAEMLSQEREVLETGAVLSRDVTRRFKDERMHSLRITKFPIPGPDGVARKVGSIAVDLTDHVEARMELRRSEALLRATIEHSTSMIAIRDLAGKVVLANAAFSRLFDKDVNAVVGLGFDELYGPAQAADQLAAHERVVTEGAPGIEEHVLSVADGDVTVLTHRFPIPGPDGAVAMVGLSSADISDRKTMELELLLARDRAEAANMAKSTFLARMSHDLRTPLNAVIGFGELMQTEAFGPLGNEKYNEYADDIVASGGYLLALVSDILDMSRIEAGEVRIAPTACDLHDAVEMAIDLLLFSAEAKGVTLENTVSINLPRASADRRALHQILVNLLSNAVKFTSAGGVVDVSTALRPDGRVMVVVSDTGRGMDAAQLKKASEPFVTSATDQLTYGPTEGAGLGLAIVRGLVEAHGGVLDIQSATGEGTQVSFTLAIMQDDVAAETTASLHQVH